MSIALSYDGTRESGCEPSIKRRAHTFLQKLDIPSTVLGYIRILSERPWLGRLLRAAADAMGMLQFRPSSRSDRELGAVRPRGGARTVGPTVEALPRGIAVYHMRLGPATKDSQRFDHAPPHFCQFVFHMRSEERRV